ncbi:hypothetical protein [Variovorax boronicumulans]|uniref:hypothetical protein n=1 Tax=Variovorax boronicumulans TaxID=436515 RepID=UPI0012E6A8A2|nr:hypothetical protein [Variovorax boronicumulans]GER21285.1 hypothetical protein VCH24_63320 [Variovorax boronicumulans]
MTLALTDAMVDGMDDMAGLLVKPQPPFVFPPSGIKHERAPKVVRIKGLQSIHRHGIPITGRTQGEADAHRRDSIRRGGI